MNSRQKGILLHLVAAGEAVTSEQLARELGVSSRTIKTDMSAMAPELADNGVELLSRRNRGYSLKIVDEDRFRKFYNVLSLEFGASLPTDEEGRLFHIARKLVASGRGVLVDELAESLYLSRGGLREPLQAALRFCESFRLKVVSTPGQGLQVTGEEHRVRLTMTELFGVHFHQAEPDPRDREYLVWIGCGQQERQDIRHAFLKLLRESPYAVRDSVSQRASMYLIIARNRRRAGLGISLPDDWVREIRTTPLYQLAQSIYGTLGARFPGYRMDQAETAFLAIYLLSNLDPVLGRSPAITAPYMAADVAETARCMLEAVERSTGTALASLPDAQPLLEQVILPILARLRYGLDGYQQFDWGIESSYLRLPLELKYAWLLGEELCRRTRCRLSPFDYSSLSCYVTALLRQVEYPIRPLRLVVTNAIGGQFAAITAEDLKRRWPELIESIRPMELYEIRGLDRSEYDAVLLGHISDHSETLYGYNYDAPAATVLLTRRGQDFRRVYNRILTGAYRFEELLPPDEALHYYGNFHYYDVEQALQYLCARYARDPESEERLLERLSCREGQLTMVCQDCAVVIGEYGLCKGERLDLYRLAKPGRWGARRIQWIVFASLPGDRLPALRAVGVVLADLTKNQENLKQFAQSPRKTLEDLLRESVQLL